MNFSTFLTTFLVALLCTSTTNATSKLRNTRQQPGSKCCFSVHVLSESINGMLLEDTIGELRIGGTFQQAIFCVSSSIVAGSLQDSLDHNCILQPSNNQFQCVSQGIPSSTKFTISNEGFLENNGSKTSWSACPALSKRSRVENQGISAPSTLSPQVNSDKEMATPNEIALEEDQTSTIPSPSDSLEEARIDNRWNSLQLGKDDMEKAEATYTIFGAAGPAELSGCINVQLLTGSFSCAAEGRPAESTSIEPAEPTQAIEPKTETRTLPPTATRTVPIALGTASPIAASGFTTVLIPSASSSTASVSSTVSKASDCPVNIDEGQYLNPNLLIPISPISPDTAFGTVYSPIIAPKNSTIYGFDIPYNAPYTGTCQLLFLLPYGNQAVFPYAFTGTEEEVGENGGINFARLNGAVNTSATYRTTPGIAADYGKIQVIPGNNFSIVDFPCPSGQQLAIEASSVGGVGLQYFQDDESVAIGLYVVPCA